LCLRVDLHHDSWLGCGILVLKTVRYIFPNNGMLVSKQLRTLQEVSCYMAGNFQGQCRGHASSLPTRVVRKSMAADRCLFSLAIILNHSIFADRDLPVT